MIRFFRVWAGVGVVCALLGACSTRQPADSVPTTPPSAVSQVPPLAETGVFPISEAEARSLSRLLAPSLQGFESRSRMEFAVAQSLKYVSSNPASAVAVEAPGLAITYGDMRRTLTRLKDLLPRLENEPELLASAFSWVRIGPDFGFTGYYEPTIPASAEKDSRFRHPLYRTPPELKRYARKGKRYHSRHAIDCKRVLRNRGLEIAWIEDPVDAFILQIQGSGRLAFADGTIRYALYDGQNRHPYKSLGKVMKDRGLLPPDGVSMPAIRDWLAAHPDQVEELLDTNPSYVFFKLADKEGSYGSMGRVLTPGVSVATDQRVLPNGLLTFMSVPLPDGQGNYTRMFHGLTLPQDTGGAIRRNRVDLFCGNGTEAAQIAGYLDRKGAVFVLLARR